MHVSLSFLISSFVVILTFRFFFFYTYTPSYSNGQQIRVDTILLEDTEASGRFQRFSFRLGNGERVFVTTQRYPAYRYGHTLRIQGRLEQKQLGKRKIFTLVFPKITPLPSFLPLQLLAKLRERIIWFSYTSLDTISANLLLGITFGISQNMPKDFEAALQKAGVLHVIAASGMNVTLVGGMFATLFGFLLKRQYALMASIGGIVCYAALSGFSPSIVRASIMGILVFSAQIMGRQSLALYGLFLAAFCMLFSQPYLLFDVGFQLSFMATLGLIVFTPMNNASKKRRGRVYDLLIKSDFFTTIIAQVMTLPILLFSFGTYAPASLLVNLLVLWMIPLLMVIGGIGTMIGLFLPMLGRWIVFLSLPFLSFFESVVWFFGNVPGEVTIEEFPIAFVLGYYCLLLAAVVWLKKRAIHTV